MANSSTPIITFPEPYCKKQKVYVFIHLHNGDECNILASSLTVARHFIRCLCFSANWQYSKQSYAI